MTEREKIVAFLRREGESWKARGLPDRAAAVWLAATAIESSDHLIRPEPTIPASEWMPKSNVGH